MSFTIPGGNSKGTAIADATDRDLQYWEDRLTKDLDAGKSRDEGRDRALRDAMRAELALRTARGGAAAPREQSVSNAAPAQMQRAQPAQLEGTFHDAKQANDRLRQASEQYNLVSPATSVGRIPEGCGVALSTVFVDAKNDTYSVGNGRGLSKSVLQKLAAALGVSWDPTASGRMDDGSDPRYCRWRAVGSYRSFDGQVQTITAEKELDLREGSPTIEGLHEQQRKKGNKNADGQVREMRMHIQQHAETKAQLRAIRSLGIKTSYTESELAKPFVAARVMWTGETSDPLLKRAFAEKQADAMLSGQRALYGRSPQSPSRALYAAPRLSPPPPVGTIDTDPDDYGVEDERY